MDGRTPIFLQRETKADVSTPIGDGVNGLVNSNREVPMDRLLRVDADAGRHARYEYMLCRTQAANRHPATLQYPDGRNRAAGQQFISAEGERDPKIRRRDTSPESSSHANLVSPVEDRRTACRSRAPAAIAPARHRRVGVVQKGSHALSSLLRDCRKRQSVASAMTRRGGVLIIPTSCNRRA